MTNKNIDCDILITVHDILNFTNGKTVTKKLILMPIYNIYSIIKNADIGDIVFGDDMLHSIYMRDDNKTYIITKDDAKKLMEDNESNFTFLDINDNKEFCKNETAAVNTTVSETVAANPADVNDGPESQTESQAEIVLKIIYKLEITDHKKIKISEGFSFEIKGNQLIIIKGDKREKIVITKNDPVLTTNNIRDDITLDLDGTTGTQIFSTILSKYNSPNNTGSKLNKVLSEENLKKIFEEMLKEEFTVESSNILTNKVLKEKITVKYTGTEEPQNITIERTDSINFEVLEQELAKFNKFECDKLRKIEAILTQITDDEERISLVKLICQTAYFVEEKGTDNDLVSNFVLNFEEVGSKYKITNENTQKSIFVEEADYTKLQTIEILKKKKKKFTFTEFYEAIKKDKKKIFEILFKIKKILERIENILVFNPTTDLDVENLEKVKYKSTKKKKKQESKPNSSLEIEIKANIVLTTNTSKGEETTTTYEKMICMNIKDPKDPSSNKLIEYPKKGDQKLKLPKYFTDPKEIISEDLSKIPQKTIIFYYGITGSGKTLLHSILKKNLESKRAGQGGALQTGTIFNIDSTREFKTDGEPFTIPGTDKEVIVYDLPGFESLEDLLFLTFIQGDLEGINYIQKVESFFTKIHLEKKTFTDNFKTKILNQIILDVLNEVEIQKIENKEYLRYIGITYHNFKTKSSRQPTDEDYEYTYTIKLIKDSVKITNTLNVLNKCIILLKKGKITKENKNLPSNEFNLLKDYDILKELKPFKCNEGNKYNLYLGTTTNDDGDDDLFAESNDIKYKSYLDLNFLRSIFINNILESDNQTDIYSLNFIRPDRSDRSKESNLKYKKSKKSIENGNNVIFTIEYEDLNNYSVTGVSNEKKRDIEVIGPNTNSDLYKKVINSMRLEKLDDLLYETIKNFNLNKS